MIPGPGRAKRHTGDEAPRRMSPACPRGLPGVVKALLVASAWHGAWHIAGAHRLCGVNGSLEGNRSRTGRQARVQ